MRTFLGDLNCPVFFTNTNGNGDSETMSTFIADPEAKQCSRYRLPVGCDAKKSRCSPKYPDPVVYKWDFECVM